MKLIDKSALIAEIDKRKIGYNTDGKHTVEYNTVKKILDILDTLEVKGVEEEPVSNDLKEASDNYVGHAPEIDEDLSCFTKRNAFIAGAQWQKERILNVATEREVKVDVGGYPYIDFTELYDFDKDIPLAKEGDKVKLVIVKNLNG